MTQDPNRLNAKENARLWVLYRRYGAKTIMRRFGIASLTLDKALMRGIRGWPLRADAVARIRAGLAR